MAHIGIVFTSSLTSKPRVLSILESWTWVFHKTRGP